MIKPDNGDYLVQITSTEFEELELPTLFEFFSAKRKFEFDFPQEPVSYELKVTGNLDSREDVTAEVRFTVTFFAKEETNIDLSANANSTVNITDFKNMNTN